MRHMKQNITVPKKKKQTNPKSSRFEHTLIYTPIIDRTRQKLVRIEKI